MPTFNFTTGTNVQDTGANPSVSFTEGGVNFTVSANASNAGNEAITYAQNNGTISLSEFGSTAGAFTMTFTDGSGNNAFAGNNMQLVFSSASSPGTVTFVATDNPANNFTAAIPTAGGTVGPGATGVKYSSIIFNSGGGGIFIDSLTTEAALVCYLEGTGIATPDGNVAVEDLRAGDIVLTANGGTSRVEWIGYQNVDTRTAQPIKVNPICITAGAIAPNVPASDLFVSPDHAIEVGGYLINASALTNGTSIYQATTMPLDGFTYFHIETGAHELLLAEGCPAESYLDAVGRDRFVNGNERVDAPIIPEMAMPRIAARRMIPPHITAMLAERAAASGTSHSTAA